MKTAADADSASQASIYSKAFHYEEIFFSLMMGISAFLSRGNPLIDYPAVLWAFGALLAFNLAYYRIKRRYGDRRSIPLISITVNILIITLILSCTGGYESYFWPMYLLPIFTACLYLELRHVLIVLCLSACFLSYFYIESFWAMAPWQAFQFFIELGVLALSAVVTMQVAFKERMAQAVLDNSRSDALQSAIFNSANFSSIATDAKGVIQIFNVGAERMLGYSAADVMNKVTPADISDPVEVVARAEALSLELKTSIKPGFEALVFKASRGIEDIYELTYIRKDGSRLPAIVSVTALRDPQKAIIGYLLIGTDNTARKQVEAERRKLDQVLRDQNVELESARSAAEKASAAKSEFLSSMSHELRSPLNAILGFAQLMESAAPPPAPAQKESIAQILQAGWHLLKLIDEILDLVKIESRQVPLSREPVSVADVMLECQGMIEPQAQQHGIKLTFPRFDSPCFVLADRTRVKQVLLNLLSNAIKYNKPAGTVAVDWAARTPERTRISVRDTGAGLPPEKLGQLFQSFNRLGQEAGAEEGTGIGLVVAKRLVELMGGAIGVESAVGAGSVFWFELSTTAGPRLALEPGGPAAPSRAHAPRPAGQHTLLYVEDNPANLKLVEQIIARRPDMRLLSAVDASIGIEIARQSRPDVILMDINLPGINGFEALGMLRADPRTARIPVIAISANAMPRDIERGLKAGFSRYITKPIKITEFMEAMDVALESAGTRSAMSK